MEVPNDLLTSMRFSSVLLAVLTASAAFSLPDPAHAQTSSSTDLRASVDSHSEVQANANPLATEQRVDAAIGRRLAGQVTSSGVPIAISSPELIPAEVSPGAIAQVPSPAPEDTLPIEGLETQPRIPPQIDPATPPPGTQTPIEETPNRLEFELLPDDNVPVPVPGEAPQIPVTPEVDPTLPPTSPLERPPANVTPTQPPGTAAPAPAAEARVLVAEVDVVATEGTLTPALQDIVFQAIRTQPGRTTTRSQLQEDINAIFATGFFSNIQAVPEDTPLGVRITFAVQPNPVFTSVRVEDSQVLPQAVINEAFAGQFGETLNFRRLQTGIQTLNQWYQTNGFVLAQVIDVPQVAPDGTVTLIVAEGVIEDIRVRFLTREGDVTDEEGEPISGRTRDFIITREFATQPGDVFNQQQIQQDLQRVFGLGIFEDVRVSLDPGQDPRQVDVVVNVTERNTGSLAAGIGFSSASGLFGTVSFQEQNLGGNNQRLGAELQVGARELLFDVNFTDPWIAGDPFRTSYTVNAFNRRSISLIFDGGETEVDLPNGDRPRVNRLGGGVSFSRPLGEWLGLEGWRGSLGAQYQRVSIRDANNRLSPVDELGNDLSFSGTGRDDLLTLQLAAVQDRRNNPLVPTSGSLLRLSTDQSIPVGQGNILFNRLRASYSYYFPVNFTNFTDGPETLAFNIQGGTVLGDLPPYEAFSLGGTDSVRGYDAGDIGSGRSFVQATAEYRFPIFAIVGGALFVDFGTDLGTASDVPGRPAEIRDKPGSGFGVGAGVRVQSPLGQIRVDYAINDQGDGRLHFGIGERF